MKSVTGGKHEQYQSSLKCEGCGSHRWYSPRYAWLQRLQVRGADRGGAVDLHVVLPCGKVVGAQNVFYDIVTPAYKTRWQRRWLGYHTRSK